MTKRSVLIGLSAEPNGFEQTKLVYDYNKFHLCLYWRRPPAGVRAPAKCSLLPSKALFKLANSSTGGRLPIYMDSAGHLRASALRTLRLGPHSSEVVGMSKSKFTEADVRRAVKGVLDGGGRVSSVEIWPDGRISVTIIEYKRRSMDPEDDPEVSRRLL